MLKNYLKIVIRKIRKHKAYSFINIAGLAVGMACTILIMLWVQDEMSYNQYHKNIEDIYWMVEWSRGESLWGSVTALGPALKKDYPEIKNIARYANGKPRFLIQYKDKSFFEKTLFCDYSIFEIFSFPIINGNAPPDKTDPYIIMLSQKKAAKFFGSDNPVGKVLHIDNQYDLKVVGVFQDIPQNSTIRFDVIVPLEFANIAYQPTYSEDWSNDGNQTYLHLQDGIDYTDFDAKIKDFYNSRGKEDRWPVIYPFKDYYLADWGRNRGVNVRLFILVAILILGIACINFMNLSTARSAQRAKEVAIRKVIGAERRQLIKQFLGESLLYSLSGMLVAGLLVISALPLFEEISGKPIEIAFLLSPRVVAGCVIVALITGIVSGSYPALFLSSFGPGVILKGYNDFSLKRSMSRKLLVLGQFVISISISICSLFIYKQVDYLQNANWGFDKKNIVYFTLEGPLKQNYIGLKSELLSNPRLISITAASHTPGGVWYGQSGWEWDGKDPEQHLWSRVFNSDPDFIETFKIGMSEGRFFRKNKVVTNEVVINEAFARRMNVQNPVGRYIKEKNINDNASSRIVGIVKNYHIAPFDRQIHPMIIFQNFKWGSSRMDFRYMFIKIRPGNISATLDFIENTVKKHNPEYPFNCQLYNQYFQHIYHDEEIIDNIIRGFAFLAIFISCLGLFGLASFATEQRKKEIGIRKTLGASIPSVMYLLSKEFIKWVILSNIIAIPLAYYFINKWLENYAYKIEFNFWFFIIPGAAALIIALITVSYQTTRAALTNPVDTLKYE